MDFEETEGGEEAPPERISIAEPLTPEGIRRPRSPRRTRTGRAEVSVRQEDLVELEDFAERQFGRKREYKRRARESRALAATLQHELDLQKRRVAGLWFLGFVCTMVALEVSNLKWARLTKVLVSLSVMIAVFGHDYIVILTSKVLN